MSVLHGRLSTARISSSTSRYRTSTPSSGEIWYQIRDLQRSLGFAAIYVTHDQEEALALSDRIAVMNRGVIEQIDRPELIYAQPKTLFVAGFLGNPNTVEGIIEEATGNDATMRLRSTILRVSLLDGTPKGGRAMLIVRPEFDRLDEGRGATQDNRLRCRVASVGFLGERRECRVKSADGLVLNFYLPVRSAGEAGRHDRCCHTGAECRAYSPG